MPYHGTCLRPLEGAEWHAAKRLAVAVMISLLLLLLPVGWRLYISKACMPPLLWPLTQCCQHRTLPALVQCTIVAVAATCWVTPMHGHMGFLKVVYSFAD